MGTDFKSVPEKGNIMTEKKYAIGGKVYIQRALVLGQTRQLLRLLDGITLPGNLEIRSLIETLGESLPAALAIVLTEEGKSPKDKDLDALASEMEFAITLEQTAQVVEDFFGCNSLPSLLNKMTEAAGKIGAGMKATELKTSASSLPAEISPGGTESSGASPLPNASPGETTDAAISSSGKP
jgi:hypothetical protein